MACLWYRRDIEQPENKAYGLIMDAWLPQNKEKVEHVFCRVTNTSNLAFPEELIDAIWETIFKDAGFKRKSIPLQDAGSQEELKEAITHGAEVGKKWH